MKIKALLLTLSTACLIPAISQAKPQGEPGSHQGPPPNLGQMFKHLDTDENGSISKAEAEAADAKRLVEHFDEIDADSDGEITKQEFAQCHKDRAENRKDQRGEHLKDLDTDKSGTISLNEAKDGDAKRLVQNFDQIDANGDGKITKEEMKAAAQKMRERRKNKGGTDE